MRLIVDFKPNSLSSSDFWVNRCIVQIIPLEIGKACASWKYFIWFDHSTTTTKRKQLNSAIRLTVLLRCEEQIIVAVTTNKVQQITKQEQQHASQVQQTQIVFAQNTILQLQIGCEFVDFMFSSYSLLGLVDSQT